MSSMGMRSIPVVAAVVGLATGYTVFQPIIVDQLRKDGALKPEIEQELQKEEKNAIQTEFTESESK